MVLDLLSFPQLSPNGVSQVAEVEVAVAAEDEDEENEILLQQEVCLLALLGLPDAGLLLH